MATLILDILLCSFGAIYAQYPPKIIIYLLNSNINHNATYNGTYELLVGTDRIIETWSYIVATAWAKAIDVLNFSRIQCPFLNSVYAAYQWNNTHHLKS